MVLLKKMLMFLFFPRGKFIDGLISFFMDCKPREFGYLLWRITHLGVLGILDEGVVDVFVTSECIHLYILCIVP